MPNYRRAWRLGGTWFFTVNLLERHGNDRLIRHIDLLRQAVRVVKRTHPFRIHAWVVLPDHLHCVIELPKGDSDFALRWRLIKLLFSRALPKTERLSAVRQRRGERGIWQRRYWEHLISSGPIPRPLGRTLLQLSLVLIPCCLQRGCSFVTNATLLRMWIMCISIRLNMVWLERYAIGRTQHSTDWLRRGSTRRIGRMTGRR